MAKGYHKTCRRFLSGVVSLAIFGVVGIGAPGAKEPTLADALAASAGDLAQGYLAVTRTLNELLPAAEQGITIHMPEGTITRENAGDYRLRFESRLAIYEDAIRQRELAIVAASYRVTSVGKSCLKARSDWASLVASAEFIDLQMSQDGFTGELHSRFRAEGAVRSFATPFIVVEDTIVFTDFLNGDYGWSGTVSEVGMEVRPLPEVLNSWPQWASPPKRKDIVNCAISFEAKSDSGTMN